MTADRWVGGTRTRARYAGLLLLATPLAPRRGAAPRHEPELARSQA